MSEPQTWLLPIDLESILLRHRRRARVAKPLCKRDLFFFVPCTCQGCMLKDLLERHCSVRQHHRAALLAASHKDHLAFLLPERRDERLSGEQVTRKSDLDVLEWAVFVVSGLACNAKRAQAVQDRLLEPADRGKVAATREARQNHLLQTQSEAERHTDQCARGCGHLTACRWLPASRRS